MQQNAETQKTEAPIADIMGLSLFNDVSNKRIQAFNRCIILLNLGQEDRNSKGVEYIEAMSNPDQVLVMATAMEIKERGFDAVRKSVQSEVLVC